MSNNKGSVTKLLGNRLFIGLLATAAVIVTISAMQNAKTDKTSTQQIPVEKEVSAVIPQDDSSKIDEKVANEMLETILPVDEQMDEPPKSITYKLPVSGEMQRDFSGDNLIWDETMKDWRTHNGVDIASSVGDEVDTAAAGKVIYAAFDERYGYVVKVDHQNGVTTVYKNLGKITVKEGDNVDEGQMIGTVGDSHSFESAQSAHLHFEVLEDGGYKNPVNFIN